MDICKFIVFNGLAVIKSIRDYYQISNSLATSEQPTPQEFYLIAQKDTATHKVSRLLSNRPVETRSF